MDSKVKIFLLNAENLFLLFDQEITEADLTKTESAWKQLSTSVFENKSLRKCKLLAQTIKEEDPDLVLLSEVGGEESLKNFNRLFLDSEYRVALIEGNSDRSIDVGFLIHKRLSCHFDVHTNKERLINFLYPHEKQSLATGTGSEKIPVSHKFSRDVAELHLFRHDRNKPFCIALLTHLKSPLDPEHIDPNGIERREAELKALVEIYNELKAKHPKVPILVSGDFNGNASSNNTDREFVSIYQQTKLQDVLELAGVPQTDRNTFYHVRAPNRAEGRQIDFAFMSQDDKHILKTETVRVIRFKNELGERPLAPANLDEKLNQPSDHYPIVFEIDFSKTN